MKICLVFTLMFGIAMSGISQKMNLVHLWPGKVPGEKSAKHSTVISADTSNNVMRISEVTDPSFIVFEAEPSHANGAAVLICPGGGYSILAVDLEGYEIAKWLAKSGFMAFVLQYRVPQKPEGALQDAQRAIRLIRNDAATYKINPDKIGIMGFSAGGSLSARACTRFDEKTYPPIDKADELSARPSFGMLIYPAYLDNGPNKSLTPELTITTNTPPLFIFQTSDDPYANSALVMAGALRESKIPVELHLYPEGGHGYGLRPGKLAADVWPKLAEKWLNRILKNQKIN
jgi:acetyl esterase/lipase